MTYVDADDGVNEYPDSGPFCRHWDELYCCDILCACGHTCGAHDVYDDDRCEADGCDCKEWRDASP